MGKCTSCTTLNKKMQKTNKQSKIEIFESALFMKSGSEKKMGLQNDIVFKWQNIHDFVHVDW